MLLPRVVTEGGSRGNTFRPKLDARSISSCTLQALMDGTGWRLRL